MFYAPYGPETILSANQGITINDGKKTRSTNIAAVDIYTRLDNRQVIEFKIALNGDYGKNGTTYQPLFLSSTGGKNFDPTIVGFIDYLDNNKIYYAKVSAFHGDKVKFGLQLLRRKSK